MKSFFLTLSVVVLTPYGLLAQSGPPVPPIPPTPIPTPTPTPQPTATPVVNIPGVNVPAVQPEGPRGGSNLSTDLVIENPEDLNLTPQVVNYYNTIINTNATADVVRQRTREVVAANQSQAALIVANALRNAPTEEVAVAIAVGAMEGIPASQAAALAGATLPAVYPDFAPAVAAAMVNTVTGAETKVAVASSILSHLPFNHSRYQDVVTAVLSALKSDALVMQALQQAIAQNPNFADSILDAAEKAFPNLKAKIDALRKR